MCTSLVNSEECSSKLLYFNLNYFILENKGKKKFIVPLNSIKSVANLRQNIKLNLPQIVRPGLKILYLDLFQKPLISLFL